MPAATLRPARLREDRVEVRVGDRAVVALIPADRRVRVGLVMPVIDRVVDVTVQPSAACAALQEAARRTGVPTSSVEAAARRALADAAARAHAWRPAAHVCLACAFGGIAFPLLAAAYDEGAEPLAEVPRWAEPVLASRSLADAATAAFGAKATRPVRRALVEAIRPLATGQIDLAVLALALMGRDVLDPDRLARVLSAERVMHPPSHLPDPAGLRSARQIVDGWGPRRVEQLLVEAAARPDGMAVLLDTVLYARQLGDHGPAHALPNRLSDVHDEHRALMRSTARPTHHASIVSATASAPIAPVPHRVLPPPPTRRGAVHAETPIPTSPVLRSLERRDAGGMGFVSPHTVGDLHRWGRLLSSCLGDFGPAAAAGRSVLVGVTRSNRLTYVVELTPDGTIRQFCGRANRRPTDEHRRVVVGALLDAGCVDPDAPANQRWLAGVQPDPGPWFTSERSRPRRTPRRGTVG